MTKKALLILVGGRQMPNFLTAQFLKPSVVVPIVSYEAKDQSWPKIKTALEQFSLTIAEPKEVDAFNLKSLIEVCRNALKDFPEVEWIFNITCATTVMSIAAFEVAKEKDINCWYLDTDTRRVETLVGKPPEGDLYKINIENYFKIYGRTIETSNDDKVSSKLEKFVRTLANNLELANAFQSSLQKAKGGGGNQYNKIITPQTEDVRQMWNEANDAGLVRDFEAQADGTIFLNTIGFEKQNFLNGDWLSMYVWLIARDVNSFDDIAYSFKIPIPNIEMREIDFALTYAGGLLIAECKTDAKPFKTNYLNKLTDIASLIGGNFVGKMLITNQLPDDSNPAFKDFCEQAKQRQVTIVQGDKLKNLEKILKKEAAVGGERPTYFRG